MVNENLTPKTEMVYELKEKYQVPSYEEFMRTYEYDSNLNYDDLNGSGVGEVRGYGPVFGYDDLKKGREIIKRHEDYEKELYPNWCKARDCRTRIIESRTYCYSHEVDPNYVTEEQKTDRLVGWGVKTVISAGASAVLGPIPAFVAGGSMWGANKIAEGVTGEKSELASAIGDFGGGLALGEVVGAIGGKVIGELVSKTGGDFQRAYDATQVSLTYGKPTGDIIVHGTHTDNGVRYDPNCPICYAAFEK